MKKVLVAGAALMLVSGFAATVSAADVKPGVVITGDARARLYYKSDEYFNDGKVETTPKASDSQTNLDTRVRLNVTGTAAGGAYAKARIRMMESLMGAQDTDLSAINNNNQNNIWVDQAYMGVPFNDMFALEVGKYRSTYGPLPTTYNFFYDDVVLTGARGIVKVGSVEINPFYEWMSEAQNTGASGFSTADASTTNDKNRDNDEMRMGAHLKAKINKDWTVGGMLAYQVDNRDETLTARANEGFFGSIYTNGKAGAFGVVAEFAYTQDKLNGMNVWAEDTNGAASAPGNGTVDSIGSKDDGFGGYVYPTYTIDKLTLGVNAGFAVNGFRPDLAYGFVMIGGKDNSIIGDAVRIGETGDWVWGGLVASYAINESLKLTGNAVYADVNSADITTNTAGMGDVPYTTAVKLDNAWELSAILQYTISKGADVFFSAGYLKPEFVDPTLRDDGILGVATRFELKF